MRPLLAPHLARLAWRESRTARRRLLLYMSSISFGVAALVAIDSFSDNVTRSVHEQSRVLMGGDVAVVGRQPFAAAARALLDSLNGAGVAVARMTTFPSMVFAQRSGATRLVQVRAVSPGFPFYGEITTRPPLAWPALRGDQAVVDAAVLVSLDAAIGDTVALGNSRFVIAGVLEKVPGELGITAAIGPRVYIRDSALPATNLLGFGSRAEYQSILRLPGALDPTTFVRRFGARLTRDSLRVRTAGYNESRLAETVDQMRDFLAIVALVALLLGGVGVASGVNAFVLAKVDNVAVLRCLGATSAQVLTIYVAQAGAMGLIGAAVGAALGIGLQLLLPSVLGGFLPVSVDVHVEVPAIAVGILVGVWVSLAFALRPLIALRRVSPLQALRRDADPAALRRASRNSGAWVVSVAIGASILGLALGRSETLSQGLAYAAAIAGALGALGAAAALLTWATRAAGRFAGRLAFPIRQGLAALHRPANQTRAVILALGFGVFLIGTLSQVQRNLLRHLNQRLEASRGNVVFFDVQANQLATVDSTVRAAGDAIVLEAPLVRMRIDSINGAGVGTAGGLRTPDGRRRASWALRREYNSTFQDTLMASERVVAGRWFAAAPAPGTLPEISIEADVAQELGLELGDTLTWNVQGIRLRTRVTSFREVRWASFQPNFFVVFQPAALRVAPKQFVILASAPGPAAVATLQRDVVRRLPTVSSIDLTLVQRTVTDVVGRVAAAVRFLALISLGLAVPVLFSAVAATRRQRVREGVLFKVLGGTRRQITQIMFVEYAALGVLGAVAGIALAVLAAWALMHRVFQSDYAPAALPLALLSVGAASLAVAIGLLTGHEVFRETPMAALRETA